jgi:hypothetical protein
MMYLLMIELDPLTKNFNSTFKNILEILPRNKLHQTTLINKH